MYYGSPAEACQSGSISDNLTNNFAGSNKFALTAAIALEIMLVVLAALTVRAFLAKRMTAVLFALVMRVCASAAILALVNAIQYIAVGEGSGADDNGVPPGVDVTTKTVYAPGPALTFVIALLLAGVGYSALKAKNLEAQSIQL
jgi:hypothetical protein